MSTTIPDSQAIAKTLWLASGLAPEPLSSLKLSAKADPAVNSSFRLGSVAQSSIGLSGLSAAHFHALRTGVEQTVTVDARHAALEFQSEVFYTIDDQPTSGNIWDPIAGLYKTKDNSYVRLHTNFPHHRAGILDILQCENTRESVQNALLQWDSKDFETEAASRKMVATAFRSFEEWDKHPQGIALACQLPVTITKVGEAPKREVKGSALRPLDGIRVLDLSRVLAGPVCGRTLAAHGADVLLITSPNLPDLPMLDSDTSRGKRTTQLDLETAKDRETLASLAKETDVFLQAYRPGGLNEKGFGVADLVEARPGIVYASLTAYGWEGPWKGRRGFDSLVQTATGFNHAEAEAFAAYKGTDGPLAPRALPMQALDHAAGYLLAFGVQAALCKTITEGGSWEVRVSLAGVGQWVRSLGRLSPEVAFGEGKPMPGVGVPQDPEIAAVEISLPQAKGDGEYAAAGEALKSMTAIGHAAVLAKTPVREGEAPLALNAHSATWLPRA